MAARVTMREPRVRMPEPGATPKPAAAASDILTVQDSRGRTLKVKKLSLWEEMNLMAAAGADRAAIPRWMQYATVVACIRQIDDDPLTPPATLRVLQSNIQLAGSEGFAAVIQALAAELPDDVGDLSDDVVGSAKNS